MIKAYLNNLVNQRIPMPNSWMRSMGLGIENTKRIEFDSKVHSENTGYSMFDSLNRGYISHKPKMFEYSSETHYLLGMYLRALRDLKGINYLPFYNCVNKTEEIRHTRYSYAPIILGEKYSIFADSILPLKLSVRYSHNGQVLLSRPLNRISTNRPIIFDSKEITGVSENLLEYLELVLESTSNIEVSVLEGIYQGSGVAPIFEGTISAMRRYDESTAGKTNILIPKLSKEHDSYSSKLIQCLLGLSVSDQSNSEIRQELISAFGNASTVSDTVRKNTKGLYDIDGNSDRRLNY